MDINNKVVIQFGTIGATSSATYTFNYPIAFTTVANPIVCKILDSGDGTQNPAIVRKTTLTELTVNKIGAKYSCSWYSIGY